MLKKVWKVARWFLIIPLGLIVILLVGWTILANIQIAQLEINDPTAGAPGDFYEVNGYRMHAVVFGDINDDPMNAPIVLVHGFGIAGGEGYIPWIANLATSGRALIVVDLLGFGYSERVTQPTPSYSHRGQAAMLKGVLDALGVEQVDLIMHSYGGAVGTQFMLDYPGRARKVAYMDAQVYDVGSGFFEVLGTLPLGIGRAMTFSSVGGGPTSFVAQACQYTSDCRALEIARIENTTNALIAFTNTPDDSRLPDDIPDIGVPALVLWGDDDNIVPLSAGERLADEVNAEIIIYPNGGHSPFAVYPDETRTAILEFFEN